RGAASPSPSGWRRQRSPAGESALPPRSHSVHRSPSHDSTHSARFPATSSRPAGLAPANAPRAQAPAAPPSGLAPHPHPHPPPPPLVLPPPPPPASPARRAPPSSPPPARPRPGPRGAAPAVDRAQRGPLAGGRQRRRQGGAGAPHGGGTYPRRDAHGAIGSTAL